jgi:hypothetical protein
MLHLTELERAALEEICRQQSGERGALDGQLATAVVNRRENSGAGFFTYLEIDRTTTPIVSGGRVLGRVTAFIGGFKQPLILMLFLKEGYAEMLEGAAVADSTVGIDLSTIQFKLVDDSK